MRKRLSKTSPIFKINEGNRRQSRHQLRLIAR
jgi:hypothetical protein